ncbi:ABC transporter permease [Kitasatospora nipponensis]|uniref:ABC transporter permease n=1 Tax=Kitasatospora nipponensis TaxID=258049 RepID=A0ABN1X058_9ACTN
MSALRSTPRVPPARGALAVLAAVALLALLGGRLAPHDPLAQDTAHLLQGPSAGHLLGTDYLGRDVLSRLLAGSGGSVLGALEAVGAAMLLGVLPGLASVRFPPALTWVSLRIVDALMTLPFTLFAIAAVGVLGNGLQQAMLALGVLLAPLFFRVTRAAALGLEQAQYVAAAELMGASRSWILRTHTWRKVLPTVAVTSAQALATGLLTVASLTFLGIGVQPPAPTWGGMLAGDLGYLAQQPWAPLFPALLIMITVGALNLLADAVQEPADGARPRPARRTTRRTVAGPKTPTTNPTRAKEKTSAVVTG